MSYLTSFIELHRLLSNYDALAEFNEQVNENLRKWFADDCQEKFRARLYKSFTKLIEKLEPLQYGHTPEQLLNIISADDTRGIRILRLKGKYPFNFPPWLESIKKAHMMQQLKEVEAEIGGDGIFKIDIDEYLNRKGLKHMIGKEMPPMIRDLARKLLNAVRVECFRRMKAARLNGEPTKLTHKIEVLYYYPPFPSESHKELMLGVIAEVEPEIRAHVRFGNDPDQQLDMLCQFHKRFLHVAIHEYLSPDMWPLKESVNRCSPKLDLH